jgi:hypothetical protein
LVGNFLSAATTHRCQSLTQIPAGKEDTVLFHAHCVKTNRALKNEWIICERDRWRSSAVGQKLQEVKVENLVVSNFDTV